jgi:hypothetical protein
MSNKTPQPRELTSSELNAVVGGVSSCNIAQVLGSALSSAGAGKVTVNRLSITQVA